ncbi:MAG TPA: hypothetical protein PK044_03605 [Exilispira sp.]|nr:hypothetical protein [Exilispira sp.]
MRWCYGVPSLALRIASQSSSLSGAYTSESSATLRCAQFGSR